jgi:toxin ParE1/3/4
VKLVWAPLAIDDREAIFDYIEEDNPRAAVDMDELFEQKALLLVEQPKIVGRSGRVAGTRELVAHRHYVLVYDVGPDRVRILRVLHTSLLWPPATGHAENRKRKKIRKPTERANGTASRKK